MSTVLKLAELHAALGRVLSNLSSLLLLGTRIYMVWQFWKPGWLKLAAWGGTLDLVRTGYHVPLLPAQVAVVSGVFGEIFFPALLLVGLFSRVGALGALLVNIMAVVSHRQMLLAEGNEAALGQHILWGFMLLTLAVLGPGKIAVDSWLERRLAARCRPFLPGLPTSTAP